MALTRKLNIYDVYDRAKSGPSMTEAQWDMEVIPNTAAKLKKKYNLKIDKKVIVPEDPKMVDSFYKAGLEMLIECGIYCTDTGRVIKYTEAEVMEAVKSVPTDITIGENRDSVVMSPRSYDSPKPPIVQGGPTGAPCSEELFLAIHQSYAQEALVETIVDGVMQTIHGRDPVPNSPYEIAAVRAEVKQIRDACMRAGRPGMGL